MTDKPISNLQAQTNVLVGVDKGLCYAIDLASDECVPGLVMALKIIRGTLEELQQLDQREV